MRKKRILYIDEIPIIAGGTNSLSLILKKLNKDKYEPYLLNPEGPVNERARKMGVKVIPYDFKHRYLSIRIRGKRIVDPLALICRFIDGFRLSRIVKRYQIDLIHCNNISGYVASSVVSFLTGIPVIWHVRTYWPDKLYSLWLPDKVIFVSDDLRKASGKYSKSSKMMVIHNGLNLDFCISSNGKKPLKAELGLNNYILVGNVGRVVPWKGLHILIESMRPVFKEEEKARLLIVGDEFVNERNRQSSYMMELKALAQKLGISDKVIFTGFRSDVSNVLSSIDIFVSSSVNDPNPRAVLEAMYMGCSIIGTRSGGVPEMIEDGKSGILVPPDDPRSMTKAVKKLIENPALRMSMGQAAKKRVEDIFTIDVTQRKIEKVYDELL